ncbi:hypothetical protein [Clostridium sp. BJN0013]|uniref:hypothetical protein n=1 Tax=Clostridium sp. BJN0013 TaxID=3236840 RepID=UPI0034C66A34
MSLPRYIINFDELMDELRRDLIQLIDDAMKDKYSQLDMQGIKALLSEIEDLLPNEKYRGLRNRIE